MPGVQIRAGDRLIDSPEVRRHLLERIRAEPALQELREVEYRQTGNMGRFFAGSFAAARIPVVLKLNTTATEIEWMTEIAARTADLIPHVYASGTTLGGADVAWLLLADTPYHFDSAQALDCRKLMAAAARFQQTAAEIDGTTYGIDREFLDMYLPQAIEARCPGPGAEVLARMPADLAWLDDNSPRVRCHGDVHFGNAVATQPGGQLLLIDPIPRTAHWAWDAAYAQMTSGVPGTPALVPLLAHAREELGLPTASTRALERIETILLGWSSMLWWAIIPYRRTEGWWAQQVDDHICRLANLSAPSSS